MINLFALHGFLGHPADWRFLKDISNANVIPIDLWQYSHLSLDQWAKTFNEQARQQTPSPRMLVGYSLGGRLALHALCQNPEQWDCAVIIAAHPGLQTLNERKERRKSDYEWAFLFQTQDWDLLLNAWYSQSIFKGSRAPSRPEWKFSRLELANALTKWSLSQQKDLRKDIENLPMPILWITGEKDKKFTELAQTLAFNHPKSRLWIAPKAGHRVPFDQKKLFCQEIHTFLGDIHYDEHTNKIFNTMDIYQRI